MKKALSLLFSLAMLLGLVLSGCSQSDKTGTESKTKGTDVTTITFWNRLPEMKASFAKIAKDFEEENPNIKVKIQDVAVESQDATFQAAVSNNKLPDVFVISNYTVPQLVQLNQLHSLKEIFPQDVRDKYQDGAFAEGLSSVDSTIYKLPLYSGYHGVYMMYYNKDVLKKLGLSEQIPKTWDQLMEIGKKVYKKSKGSIYGVLFGSKSDFVTVGVANQMASAISPESGLNYKTGQYNYATQGNIETIQFFKKMLDEKVLSPSSLETQAPKARALFASGNAAFYFDGNWSGARTIGDFNFKNWGAAPLPTKDGQPEYKRFQGGVAEGFGVAKYTKHWPEVKKFMIYLRDHTDAAVVQAGVTESPKKQQFVDAKSSFPQYQSITKIMDQTNLLMPNPYQRNSETINVDTEFNNKKTQQTLGLILTGYLTGQVKDLKGTLQKWTDDTNKVFDQAIQSNDKVTKNDYTFPNWVPNKPYSAEDYKGLK